MDRLQQRIIEIAQQLPEYVGYQAKEQRREEDKLVRRQLAGKYEEQRVRLARVSRQAPLDHISDLENIDQKLQRLVARLQTAPPGYAGWFDAGQIVQDDLDQLIRFDAALTGGVAKIKDLLDRTSAALKTKQGVDDVIASGAELIDALNGEFDQREQFLSIGKKPAANAVAASQPSPLAALKTRPAVSAEWTALLGLKLRDAVSYDGVDYVVTGRITYTNANTTFWALLLQDNGQQRWLHIGPDSAITLSQEIDLNVASPFPERLDYEKATFERRESGSASVTVEGAGGTKRGTVTYAGYAAESDENLWVENFGIERRTLRGHAASGDAFKIYRR